MISIRGLSSYRPNKLIHIVDSTRNPLSLSSHFIVLDYRDLRFLNGLCEDLCYINLRKETQFLTVLLAYVISWKKDLIVYTSNELFWKNKVTSLSFNRSLLR